MRALLKKAFKPAHRAALARASIKKATCYIARDPMRIRLWMKKLAYVSYDYMPVVIPIGNHS